MSEDELEIKPSTSAASAVSAAGSVEAFTSPSRKKTRRGRKWDVDGINVDEPGTFIARENLVARAIGLARESRVLVVGSPPGTGKTVLLQLIQEKLREENEANASGKIRGFNLRPSHVQKITDLFEYVAKNTGVSLDEYTLEGKSSDCSEVWLLFDDAQRLYGSNFFDFWEHVTKQKQAISKAFGKRKIIIVVFATYYLSNKSESPVCFRNQNRLELKDLRLEEAEAADLYRRRCMYPAWKEYFERLFYVTNGTAAAFTIGLNRIVHLSETADFRSTDEALSESYALSELIERTPFNELERCFPVSEIDDDARSVILDALVEAYQADMGRDSVRTSEAAIIKLIKGGILTESMRFTSPIAERFYYHEVFPRAASGTDVPETIDDLIERATEKLSARRLRVACQETSGEWQSPKEAVFQQLFHEAIASLLPVSYRIIPELGTEAKIRGEVVTGELDFYIKNGNKWALELLRDGSGRKEHLNRIPGKYRNVEADSWLVVDCRIGTIPRTRDDKLCTLVFDNDFGSCQCYMRRKDARTITLGE